MSVNYDAASVVISSKYRIEVIQHLQERPKTPSQITEEVDHDGIAHISRALQQLREEDLVDLLVDESRKKGRIYGLTGAGEEVAEYLEEIEGDETVKP